MPFYRIIGIVLTIVFCSTCSNDSETPPVQNRAPNAFALSFVEDNATEIELSPSFSWQTAVDADGDSVTYDLFLDTNTTPVTKLGSNLTNNSFELTSDLNEGTTYYWFVTAKDSNGNSTTSKIFSFTTLVPENQAPARFDLLTLENNTENASLTPSFTWMEAIDPDDDPVSYDFLLGTDENPETIIAEGIADATFNVTDELLNNTTYYWKVVAKDQRGNTSVSNQIFSFTTLSNAPPSDFNLVTVIDGATSVILLPTFTWQMAEDDDPVSYDLYLGTENDPLLWAENITETTYTLTELLFLNQTYYWKVVAKDNAGNSTSSEVFSFTTRGLKLPANALTTAADFSPRAWHTSVVFNNKIWVIGGYNGDGTLNGGTDFFNDIWSSVDGISWTLETANAGFSARYDHSSVVFDNKLWVIGGKAFDVPGRASNAPFEDLNDVWSSTDGVNWTQVTANAPFSIRGGHTLDVLNGKLYLISGGFNSFGTEEIWSTTNGADWTLESDNLSFNTSSRHNHRTVKLGNTYFLTGGATVSYDEIWKSTDLINWTLVKDDLVFLARRAPSFHNFNGNLLYFAGLEPNKAPITPSAYRQDVWYSIDGENWSQGAEQAPYLERYQHTSVVFEGKIYVIGGRNTSGYLNDVWSFD